MKYIIEKLGDRELDLLEDTSDRLPSRKGGFFVVSTGPVSHITNGRDICDFGCAQWIPAVVSLDLWRHDFQGIEHLIQGGYYCGVSITPKYRCQQFGTKLTQAIIKNIQETGFNYVTGMTKVDNIPINRILANLGFEIVHEGLVCIQIGCNFFKTQQTYIHKKELSKTLPPNREI